MSRQVKTDNKITLNEEQTSAKTGGKLLFTDYRGCKAAFLIRENRLRAAHFLSQAQDRIGAIYICKVKNVAKNLGACFVEIGGTAEREVCFLSAKDAAHPFLLNRKYDGRILAGDEFPVQLIKEASKNKQASVTTLISIANPYFAFSVGKPGIGYSTKLTPEQKKTIQTILEEHSREIPLLWDCTNPQKANRASMGLPVGLVVRTRAAELLTPQENTLLTVLRKLAAQWENLFRNASHRTCFSCLSEPTDSWEAVLEQMAYPYEYEEILTDDAALYDSLCACQQTDGAVIPSDKTIRLYAGTDNAQLPLAKLYGLNGKLTEAFDRKVWLKCGGYLFIDPTEALTVIDVNSDKYESKKDAEEAYFRVNRDAAEEIARQIRLRNLSGMILVDFINMKATAHQEELLELLRTLVKQDKQKTAVVDMTALGLVEITRKKSSKPLAEQFRDARMKTWN